MEVIVNTSLATHRFKITSADELLDFINELPKFRLEDNDYRN